MTQEEKAKAYEEALRKVKALYDSAEPMSGCNVLLETVFPELKDSEDEKIKRFLIDFIKVCGWSEKQFPPREECIAWLEKQGEQKVSVADFKAKDWYMSKVDGKIHNIYHSVDKVEPKFKVGDWITNGFVGGQITSIEDNYPCYKIADFMGGINTSIPFTLQDNYHLWSIKDAKDGDVLASELCDSIILFRGIKDDNIDFYCDYDFSKIDIPGDRFAVNNGQHYGNVEDSKDFHPATKEQRDTLLKAMVDAGYKWDSENKILLSLKEEPNSEQKLIEWSEEDERHKNTIIRAIHGAGNITPIDGELAEKWLKSLRLQKRWKPADKVGVLKK